MININKSVPLSQSNLKTLQKSRIAHLCVCCGSESVETSSAVLMPFIAHRVFNWKPVEIDDSWGLKSIKNGQAYSICNSLFCKECGLLFLDLRFSAAEMSRLYQDYRGQSYTALRELYEPGYEQRNKSLENGINYIDLVEAFILPHITIPLSILDWGGDTGKNTPFKQIASTFNIFDLSNKEVIGGAVAVNKEQAFEKKYDLVVCSNVLEHVSFPSEILFELKNTMHSNSILYIEVPFEDLMKNNPNDCLAQKKHWHEHINFFSKDSLIRVVDHCGFELIQIETLVVTTPQNFENKKIESTLLQMICKLKRE